LPQLGSFDWGKPHCTLRMTGRGVAQLGEASKWARSSTSSGGRLAWVPRIRKLSLRVGKRASARVFIGPGRRSQPRALQHGRGPSARKEVTWEGNEPQARRSGSLALNALQEPDRKKPGSSGTMLPGFPHRKVDQRERGRRDAPAHRVDAARHEAPSFTCV